MKISFQNFFQAILLLALFLSPGRLIAQEPQGAQSPVALMRLPLGKELHPRRLSVNENQSKGGEIRPAHFSLL